MSFLIVLEQLVAEYPQRGRVAIVYTHARNRQSESHGECDSSAARVVFVCEEVDMLT